MFSIRFAAFGACSALFVSLPALSQSGSCLGAVQWTAESGGNGHYYARIFEPMNWEDARIRAEVLGGHLATITSQAENDFVMPLCLAGGGPSSWLGGKRIGKSWTWVTGEPWSFANWAPGEPNNTNGMEFYLLNWFGSPQWNDGGNYPGTFIVEWEVLPTDDCDGNGSCDLGEIIANPALDSNLDGVLDACQCVAPHPSAVLWPTASGGNDHYYARIAQALTWEQARVAAQQLGGHLATITSAAENAFITPLVIDGSNNVSHLGGYRVQNGWAWVTGEPWGYSNWYPGEPNNNSGDENFLATWVSPGTWNDIFPSYLAHFVVEWDPAPHDCNNNQICDIEEIAANSNLDINRDGALDSCQCIADVVADGAINGVDLARVINDWGMANSVADINRDGIVAGADLALVLSSWGPCAP